MKRLNFLIILSFWSGGSALADNLRAKPISVIQTFKPMIGYDTSSSPKVVPNFSTIQTLRAVVPEISSPVQRQIASMPVLKKSDQKLAHIQTFKPVVHQNTETKSVAKSEPILKEPPKAVRSIASAPKPTAKTSEAVLELREKTPMLTEPVLEPLPEQYKTKRYKVVKVAPPLPAPTLPEKKSVPRYDTNEPANSIFDQFQKEVAPQPKSLRELIGTPNGLNEPVFDAPDEEELPSLEGE